MFIFINEKTNQKFEFESLEKLLEKIQELLNLEKETTKINSKSK